jgi:hypothetical protein
MPAGELVLCFHVSNQALRFGLCPPMVLRYNEAENETACFNIGLATGTSGGGGGGIRQRSSE